MMIDEIDCSGCPFNSLGYNAKCPDKCPTKEEIKILIKKMLKIYDIEIITKETNELK